MGMYGTESGKRTKGSVIRRLLSLATEPCH
jgi:hypothetical protein